VPRRSGGSIFRLAAPRFQATSLLKIHPVLGVTLTKSGATVSPGKKCGVPMLRLILVFALAGMAGIANAGDIYFYDLLKDPVYARSWKAALDSAKGVPAWLRDEDRFIASPAKTVSIDAKTYSVSVLAI